MKLLNLIIPPGFKLAAVLAAALALGGAAAYVAHLHQADKAHRACLASVQGKPGARPVAQTCEKPIATLEALAITGTAANLCDAALAPLKAGVPAICSPAVRALGADRDRRAEEAANLKTQLLAAQADARAAIDRAVQRERTTAQRKSDAKAVVAAVPRDADGLRTLDAASLRQLAGAAPP